MRLAIDGQRLCAAGAYSHSTAAQRHSGTAAQRSTAAQLTAHSVAQRHSSQLTA